MSLNLKNISIELNEIRNNTDEDIDYTMNKLSNLKIKSSKRYIIWQIFSIHSPSDINWNTNKILVNENISNIILNINHYQDCINISETINSYMEHNLILEFYNLNNEYFNYIKSILNEIVVKIIPIYVDINLCIAGIFILNNNNFSNIFGSFTNNIVLVNLIENIGKNRKINLFKNLIFKKNINYSSVINDINTLKHKEIFINLGNLEEPIPCEINIVYLTLYDLFKNCYGYFPKLELVYNKKELFDWTNFKNGINKNDDEYDTDISDYNEIEEMDIDNYM
jgi:hypothetical protein